ncbi:MAG: acetoin utilization protein AcuC [Candidatus Thorarchaeota archaeon]
MSGKTALFDSSVFLEMDGLDELAMVSPDPNPFWNKARFDMAWSLPMMCKVLNEELVIPQPMRTAGRDELGLFHDISYIETMELFGNTGTAFSSRMGLDTDENPIFQDVHIYASYPVGAAIDGIMGVEQGKFSNAMSFFGGLHHAFESRAAGFCYYNDVAIAIKKYKQEYPGKKILYLDTDVHHGDGVQAAFYDDPDVLTISMHELSMGFFPGTGRPEEMGIGEGKGYSVNLPLPPLTDDFEFWRAFEDVVVPLWLAFKPDMVFWDVGADAHLSDPLADLMLTYDTYHRLSKTVHQLVHLGSRKLVVTGGGGYNPVAAGKVWTIVLSNIAGIALPPTLPPEWIKKCISYGLEMPREGWHDRPTRIGEEHYPKIRRAINEAIDKVQTLIFPIHGLEK